MTLKNTDIYDITIYNRQIIDGRTDVIEEKNTGRYCLKNNKAYIMYENGGISSTVIADGDTVKIKRNGQISSDMLLKCGKKLPFMYRLPYGAMEMEAEASCIEAVFDENGGKLHAVYTLFVQGEEYYNDMEINIVKR